jgi:hypothetical protein
VTTLRKPITFFIKTKKSIPRDGALDIKGARLVADSWKEFGLQKPPPPVDGVIDMSYLQEARN